MRAKHVVVAVTLIALISFGTVSTASALVDPLTIGVVGLGVMTVATFIAETNQVEDTQMGDQVATVPDTVEEPADGAESVPQPN